MRELGFFSIASSPDDVETLIIDLLVLFTADGAQAYEHAQYNFTVMMLQILNLPPWLRSFFDCALLVGLCFGPKEPPRMHPFVAMMVHELHSLAEGTPCCACTLSHSLFMPGVFVHTTRGLVRVRVFFGPGSCDLRALPKILGRTFDPGVAACATCKVTGLSVRGSNSERAHVRYAAELEQRAAAGFMRAIGAGISPTQVYATYPRRTHDEVVNAARLIDLIENPYRNLSNEEQAIVLKRWRSKGVVGECTVAEARRDPSGFGMQCIEYFRNTIGVSSSSPIWSLSYSRADEVVVVDGLHGIDLNPVAHLVERAVRDGVAGSDGAVIL